MTHTLDKQAAAFPQLESTIKEMRTLYNGKLWFQLATVLLRYVDEPALQTDRHLIELYDGFIKEIESNIDEIICVQLVNKASDQYDNLDQKLSFLQKINDSVLSDRAAKLLLKSKMAEHKLQDKKLDETLKDITELTKEIETISDLDPIVYSAYYHLTSKYYFEKKNYEEFYKNSLQYLAYTHESKIKPEEKIKISQDMGIAVLVSNKIYNFSELLEQPVLKALVNTEYEWIYKLLQTFNAGNIQQYQRDLKQNESVMNSNKLLKEHHEVLEVKIKIMALLELVFNRPKNNRNVSFEDIAKVAGIPTDQVEKLVIKSMSLEQIKGSIDQIEQIVKVTWIRPRVLDAERVNVMKKKFDEWNKTLEDLVKVVESGNFAVTSFL